MNTNLRNNTEATPPTSASRELPGILELLARGGLAGEAVFDGDGEGCPHCLGRALLEAA